MKRLKIEGMNSERFLTEAFDPELHNRRERGVHLRRNIYLGLFWVGMAGTGITALSDRILLSVLSLFLAVISLVVMTKYDTQLFFLRIIKRREENRK